MHLETHVQSIGHVAQFQESHRNLGEGVFGENPASRPHQLTPPHQGRYLLLFPGVQGLVTRTKIYIESAIKDAHPNRISEGPVT